MPGGRAVSRISGVPANTSLRIKLSGGACRGYEPLVAPALEPYYEPWCEPLQPHNQPQCALAYHVYPDSDAACDYAGSGAGWSAAKAYGPQEPPLWQQGRLTVLIENSSRVTQQRWPPQQEQRPAAPTWQQQQQQQQAAQQKPQQTVAPSRTPPALQQKPVLVRQAQQAQRARQRQQQQHMPSPVQQQQTDTPKTAASSNSSGGGGSPWRELLSPPPRAAAKQASEVELRKPSASRVPNGSTPSPAATSPLLADYTPMPPSAAAATPLLADYTPVPPPTSSSSQVLPLSSTHTSSSAVASPIVPDFIQRLWQEQGAQQSAQQAKQAQQEPTVLEAPRSTRSAAAAASQPAGEVAAAVPDGRAAGTPDDAEVAAAEQQADVEDGELVGECFSSCGGKEPWREPLSPPPSHRQLSSGVPQCSHSYSDSSRGGRGSQVKRQDGGGEQYGTGTPSRGRQVSLHFGCSQRSRHSSSRSSSHGRHSGSSECELQRHGGRNRKNRRRPPRSKLRRAGRGDACTKRRAAATAAPPPADAPLALASLVESMAAEAALLQRQLGRLTVNDATAEDDKDCPVSSGVGAGPVAAPPASGATSPSAAVSKAADVDSQLAALSSKLGQLTLCLQTIQQQQQPAMASGDPPRPGDRGSGSEAGRFYLVFDTNVFMDHSRLIKHDCWKAILASGSTATGILVPLEVVRELDGIKKCFFRGFWAQRAIRRLEGMQGHAALRGQREDERYQGLLRRNDDGILDCCLLFRSRGAQVQLCSKDVNLRVRARTEGIPCCRPADVLPLLRDRLAREAPQQEACK